MTRFGWAAGVATCGIAVVGVITGCVYYAIPDRPAAWDWPLYAPLLFGPYLIGAVASWRAVARQAVRTAALIVCVTGVVMAAVAVADAWHTFIGGPAPAIPSSTLVVGALLLVQYWVGIAALAVGHVRTQPGT